MNSREAIAEYGNELGYIFKVRCGKAYITVGNGIVVGKNGYMQLESLASSINYRVTEVWKIGTNPGRGLDEILTDIETGRKGHLYEEQAYLVADIKDISSKFLNIKVFVGTKSAEIQNKFFKMGYRWCSNEQVIQYVDEPFLYVDDRGRISYTSSCSLEYFTNHRNRLVTMDEILAE